MTLRLFAVLLLSLTGLGAVAAEAPRGVVELFTSQGCSSCPPADRLMAELARDPKLIVLSYPVQLWDHLGWRDTLATQANTERQKAYAEARGDRRVYTPQAIINGVSHSIGSVHADIEAKLARRGHGRMAAALTVPVSVQRMDGRVVAQVGQGEPGVPARIVFVVFEREHRLTVERGENAGATISYINVVRETADMGTYTGAAVSVSAPMPAQPGLSVAVLVQMQRDRTPGIILGAARLR